MLSPESTAPELLLEQCRPAIERTVRRMLRVTLRKDDLRQKNQDAFDLIGDVHVRLLINLEREDRRIENLCGYAKVVARNKCADYIAAKCPEWHRLKICIRRFFDKSDRFTTWKNPEQELLCGIKESPFQDEIRPDALLSLYDYAANGSVWTSFPRRSGWEKVSRQDWDRLFEEIFQQIHGSILLDDLVSFTAKMFQIADIDNQPLNDVDHEDDSTGGFRETAFPAELGRTDNPESFTKAYMDTLHCERLKLLWTEILELLPWHRVAYLLNMPTGEIEAFDYYQVATVREVGLALGLTPEQFERFWAEFPEADRALTTILTHRDEMFAVLWRYLPLDDNQIARMLSVTRAQVIGYRNKALERIRRHWNREW